MSLELVGKINEDLSLIQQESFQFIKRYPFKETRQLCLTHPPDIKSEVDRIYTYSGSLKGTELNEFDFSCINEELRSTGLYRLIERISEKWDLGRCRLCLLPPRTCYSLHVDVSPVRFHLVISTNPQSFIIHPERNSMIQVPEDGGIYAINTGEPHTAMNCGSSDRIHMVMEIGDKKG